MVTRVAATLCGLVWPHNEKDSAEPIQLGLQLFHATLQRIPSSRSKAMVCTSQILSQRVSRSWMYCRNFSGSALTRHDRWKNFLLEEVARSMWIGSVGLI